MKRAAAFVFGVILFVVLRNTAYADPPAPYYVPPAPPLTGQPNPDVFMYQGASLEPYNAAQKQLMATGVYPWQYVTAQGCSGLDNGLKLLHQQVMTYITTELRRLRIADVEFRETTTGWKIVGSCGVLWQNTCPGAVGCLNGDVVNGQRVSYPYNTRIDYDAPTLLSYAFEVSKQAVVLHELLGHAFFTWCEQYQWCQRAFNPMQAHPGWRDFMNTGPDSRHLIEATEAERLKRSIWAEPYRDICGAARNQPCAGTAHSGSIFYLWFCEPFDDIRVTRISVLWQTDPAVADGSGWYGVHLNPDDLDGNRCRGYAVPEFDWRGRKITWLLKRENAISWQYNRNEVVLP